MIRLPQTSLSCKSLIASCLPSSVSKTTKPKPLIPSLAIAFNPLVELISQALLQLRQQFQLIAVVPAFQGALASAAALQLLQQHFFANHDRGQPGTGGQPQIKVGEVAVVSHQGRPLHANALGAIMRCRLGLFQRDGHGAGFRSSGSTEEQALVGFQQIEPNRAQVEVAQPTQQWASAQL